MVKLHFWQNYLECIRITACPCGGGDFNIIRNNSQKNKPVNTDHLTFLFNAIIEHVGLNELPLNGRQFTWANNTADPTYEKLDRILICPWEDKFPLVWVQALEREISDHTPLIMVSRDYRNIKL